MSKNITQFTPQTVSADPTSLFYTVTGGSVDRSLPLSVLVNNLGLTGIPTTITAAASTNSTQIASCAFAQSAITLALAGVYAPLANPTFTGTVIIPTATINGGTINSTTIGATTASTGRFTTASTTGLFSPASLTTANATITGGSINSTPVGGGTPASGAFTSISATSTITPNQTAGIVGTTTNNSANAGSVGEYVTATALTVSTTSATPLNVTSISLTAGDWDVSGVLQVIPAASTTLAGVTASISTTSGATGPFGTSTFLNLVVTTGYGTGQSQGIPTPVVRLSLASTTTVFLVAVVVFGTSTLTSSGLIRARRMR